MEIDKDYNLMVGLRIREARESMQLSREKFSEKCDISASFLSAVERGQKSLTAKSIYKICCSCNITADYIIFGHEEGFEKDIILETMHGFDDDKLIHVVNILNELKSF